jgi:hypothetical protein
MYFRYDARLLLAPQQKLGTAAEQIQGYTTVAVEYQLNKYSVGFACKSANSSA